MTKRDDGAGESLLLAELEVGDRAELRDFRVERLERRCRSLGLEAGVTVRCRSRDGGDLELVLPDGETVWVGRPVADQIRVDRPASRPEVDFGGRSDRPTSFLEELFRGGTQSY